MGFGFPQEQENLTIEVVIRGISEEIGTIRIGLYGSDNTFLSFTDVAAGSIVKAQKGEVKTFFKPNKKGKYAVAVLHDENSNTKMDVNFFGIPQEPFGFSLNPRVIFRAPRFNDCAFDVNNYTKVIIDL